MAVSAREVILVFRGQNYLSGAIKRVGRDIGSLSRAQQLAAQRTQLGVVRERMNISRNAAQEELRSVQTNGKRWMEVQAAKNTAIRREGELSTQLRARENQLVTAGERRATQLGKIASIQAAIAAQPGEIAAQRATLATQIDQLETGSRRLSLEKSQINAELAEGRQLERNNAIVKQIMINDERQLRIRSQLAKLAVIPPTSKKFIGVPEQRAALTAESVRLARERPELLARQVRIGPEFQAKQEAELARINALEGEQIAKIEAMKKAYADLGPKGALQLKMLSDQLSKANLDAAKFAEQEAILRERVELANKALQEQGLTLQQVAAREAALKIREEQLYAIIQARTHALDVNTAALDRNAIAMKALPWERFVSGASAVEHAGRVIQMFGLISAAAFGYFAHSFAQFNTQITLAATQSTTAMNNTTAGVLRNARVLQQQVLGMLSSRGQTPFASQDLSNSLYQIFSGITLKGNQANQLRQGISILKEFNKVAVANYGIVSFNDVTKAGIALINNFNLSARQLPTVMNRVQASVRFAATDMGTWTQSLNQVIPAFRGAHYSFNQMAVDIAFISRFFPSLRTGTTGLARLTEMFGRTQTITGIRKQLGIDIAPGGRLLPLQQIAALLARARPELVQGKTDLNNFFKTFGGSQGTVQARRALVAFMTQQQAYHTISRQVLGDNNELAKSFTNMSQTPQVRWAEFTQQLRALVMTIGAGALPAFKAFAQPIEAMIRGFNNLSPGMQKAIGYFGALLAVGSLLGGTIMAIAGGLTVLIGRARLMAGFAKGGLGILGLGFGKNVGQMTKEADTLGSKLVFIRNIQGEWVKEAGMATSEMTLALGGGALFLAALPIMIKYRTQMQHILGVSLSLQGVLKVLSIAFSVMAARALLSVGAMAAARVGATELAASLTALASVSLAEVTIAITAGYMLSKAIRSIPHAEPILEKGGTGIYDLIYGQPGPIKTPSGSVMQRQIAQVNRLYQMYAKRGLKPVEIQVRIKADMPGVNTHDLSVFINNAAKHARLAAQAAAESGSQRFFHDQPVNFAQRLDQAVGRQQATIRQKTTMQQVPGWIANINRLKRASEGYPPSVAKIERYNAYLDALQKKLKTQPGLYNAITTAADQLYQYTGGVSDAAALRETRNLEKMRKALEKNPSLEGWIRYYKAVDDLNSKMSSSQQSAVQAMLQKNQQAVNTTVANARSAIQQIAGTLTSTFQNLQQQNITAFGAIGQGPFIQSARFQNYMQWGGKITGRDLLRDLRSQVAQFRRWRGVLNQLLRRGAPFALIQQLQAAGPTALPEAQALLSLNQQQFGQYVQVFREGQQLILKATSSDVAAQIRQWRTYGRNIMLAILKGMDENSARFANYFRNLAISLFPELARQARAHPRPTTGPVDTRGLPHTRTHPAARHTPAHRTPRYTPPHVPLHPPRSTHPGTNSTVNNHYTINVATVDSEASLNTQVRHALFALRARTQQ